MIKFQPGDIYYTHDDMFIKIVNVNNELLAYSLFNKSITVQCLNTGDEINLSYNHLDTWGIKYLGRNEGAAWVLYGSNLKKLNKN